MKAAGHSAFFAAGVLDSAPGSCYTVRCEILQGGSYSMSEPITKPRVSAAAKTALVLAAAAVLLAVFALAAPGSKFFFRW